MIAFLASFGFVCAVFFGIAMLAIIAFVLVLAVNEAINS